MTILIIIKLLKILLGRSKEVILGEMGDDFDCMCFKFSPMPNFKASFVSSDGENPPPPLNLAFTQAMSIFASQLRMSK